MRNISFIFFTFLLIANCLVPTSIFSQHITFEKWYDYGFGEEGNCVQQTSDGGYIIAGEQIVTMGVSKNLLVKTDSTGNVMWFKLFGGTSDNLLNAIRQTTDGGFIMTGQSTGMQANYYDITWLKTDSNGDTVWTRKLTPPVNSIGIPTGAGEDILQTSDGGYMVLATSWDTTTASMIIKTDSNGNILWTKRYSYPNPGIISKSMRQTTDGGFILGGYISLPGSPPPPEQVFLVKTDSSGDTLWTKILHSPYHEAAWRVEPINGGYFISGRGSYNNIYSDIFIAKTNTNGDTLWTKKFGGSSADDAGTNWRCV